MVSDVRVGVLGPLAMEVDGSVRTINSPSQRTILLRLAIEPGHPVSIDQLVDALWPTGAPKNPPNALRYHVWKLRESLGGVGLIETAHDGYRLLVDAEDIDANRFETLVNRGVSAEDPSNALALLDEALALWRAHPFTDARDAEFAQAEIRRLTEAHRIAREGRAKALVGVGRSAEAIPELEGLLEAHPYSEGSWTALMTALYREGRQSDALQAYQRARAALGEDLGLEPSPELRDLEERVLLHDDRLAFPVPVASNLPSALTTFIGRGDEIAEIDARFEARRLVTILGAGGSGKTRLAIEYARLHIERFAAGAWIVDLAPSVAGDDVFRVVARALGLSSTDQEATSSAEVLGFLHFRDALLILDNCEHLLEDAARMVIQILERAPGVRVLVTSRAPLHVPGESVLSVPGLEVPPDDATWEDLARFDSSRLLVERAEDAGDRIERSEANAQAVADICRIVDGMPLAIELVGSRVRTIGLEALPSLLSDRLTAFGSSRTMDSRHRTMGAMIDWSYDLLTPDQQALFRTLGSFVGGFTIDAASHVATSDHVPRADIADHLEALVDQSLVVQYERRGERFGLLEPFRLFALERLDETDELERTLDRHADAIFDVVERADGNRRGPDRVGIFMSLRADMPNIRRALEHFESTHDDDRLCRMVASIAWFWTAELFIDEAVRWGEACLPHLDEADPAVGARIHTILAAAAAAGRSPERGPDYIDRALELAHETDDELLLADTIVTVVRCSAAFGDSAGDIELSETAIDIYERHDDEWGLLEAFLMLCGRKLWDEPGSAADVIQIARRAKAIGRRIGDTDGTVCALINEISALTVSENAPEVAPGYLLSLIDETMALANDTISPMSVCDALLTQGSFLVRQGDTHDALALYQKSARLADEAGALFFSIAAHTQSAIACLEVDQEGAVRSVETALRRAIDRSVERQTVWVIEVAARVLLAPGEHDLAARLIGAAERHRDELPNPMPPWDLAYYAETREAVRRSAGSEFEGLRTEGASWSITQAAQIAADLLRTL
jgi:predicted ATPase/DNA-binding SARP family transcriptional activator